MSEKVIPFPQPPPVFRVPPEDGNGNVAWKAVVSIFASTGWWRDPTIPADAFLNDLEALGFKVVPLEIDKPNRLG